MRRVRTGGIRSVTSCPPPSRRRHKQILTGFPEGILRTPASRSCPRPDLSPTDPADDGSEQAAELSHPDGMPFLTTTKLEQHLEADTTFGPCLRPDCPNYAETDESN